MWALALVPLHPAKSKSPRPLRPRWFSCQGTTSVVPKAHRVTPALAAVLGRGFSRGPGVLALCFARHRRPARVFVFLLRRGTACRADFCPPPFLGWKPGPLGPGKSASIIDLGFSPGAAATPRQTQISATASSAMVFVSGHDFSRAESAPRHSGFSRCVRPRLQPRPPLFPFPFRRAPLVHWTAPTPARIFLLNVRIFAFRSGTGTSACGQPLRPASQAHCRSAFGSLAISFSSAEVLWMFAAVGHR